MRFKRLLALLLAAALALSLLAGCGGGESAASALLKLLDGRYPNTSIEIDPELEADLRQAIRKAEAENAGDDAAVIRAALETALGSTITFRYLGDGQKGDTAFDLVFYAGSDPDKAAQAAYSQWNLVFSNVPDDGKYDTSLAMVETNSGVWMLVKATVEKAGTVDKPDTDDDEPEPPEQEKGYTVSEDGKTYEVYNADGLMAWNKAVQGNLSLNCTLTEDITIDSDWEPIGSDLDGFTGTFDGGNHTITMESIGTQVLFQYIAKSGGSTGTVKDLTIQVDSTITGPDNSHLGAVAMVNYGTIQNCHVTGGGTIQGSTGYSSVGGIVGVNGGTIQGCSATVAVKNGSTGGTVGTGGIVGNNLVGSTVTACYHAGTVQGSSSTGGVVGYNNGTGTVNDCYWSGQVSSGYGIGYDDKQRDHTNANANPVTGSDTWTNIANTMNDAIPDNCPYQWDLSDLNLVPKT